MSVSMVLYSNVFDSSVEAQLALEKERQTTFREQQAADRERQAAERERQATLKECMQNRVCQCVCGSSYTHQNRLRHMKSLYEYRWL